MYIILSHITKWVDWLIMSKLHVILQLKEITEGNCKFFINLIVYPYHKSMFDTIQMISVFIVSTRKEI